MRLRLDQFVRRLEERPILARGQVDGPPFHNPDFSVPGIPVEPQTASMSGWPTIHSECPECDPAVAQERHCDRRGQGEYLNSEIGCTPEPVLSEAGRVSTERRRTRQGEQASIADTSPTVLTRPTAHPVSCSMPICLFVDRYVCHLDCPGLKSRAN